MKIKNVCLEKLTPKNKGTPKKVDKGKCDKSSRNLTDYLNRGS